MSPPRLLPTAVVVTLGAALSILDTTVVTVALETLGRELGASLTTLQWVATAYLLALATTIPLTGWAADRFGARRLFLAAVGAFTAASALAGLAWSAEALIAFRVLQGLGGGLIMPAGIVLVGEAAGPQRMARTMSAIGIPLLVAPALGPLVGGALLDAVSWRWVFLVNLPIGLLVLALATRLLPPQAPPRPALALDRRGLLLLAPGLVALVYGLSRIAADGVAGGGAAAVSLLGVALTPAALLPLATGALLLAAFTRHALRTRDPLLELRLLREPAVGAAALALLLLGGAFLGALFLLPLELQTARGATPLQTGLLLLPQGVAAALAIALAGRLSERVGAGRIVAAGLLPFALALLWLTRIGASAPTTELCGALALFGLGMGATMMPAMTAAYAPLQRAQVARATALLTVVQRLGSSLGAALAAVALTHGLGGASSADATARGAAPACLDDAFASALRWPLLLVLLALGPAVVLAGRRLSRAQAAAPRP
ncbi:DHA2 family efflux MFS transporter permease subunit [Conexibacter sp. JD483]|uniref:DHA2 family efflux MFS transporter permease subunit n=1 Tax=unclassified Conexibacter TaxID=2627773 RepID=UPI0027254D5C|nr:MULTISPECIES: DHA2 family efflux MFS transporter permease subunit [unclassified Conexibacter]MDO8185539.1 DHA2 family efflux MFS transporter permease subunit [Conexibacter sp. CPCC 205706]MDO8197274.1 DHA2 family efflux MFS transporter permease subunit [Conexibacter sp. CPCC 205762]MDR9370770.1 DHA2 family efflux MFS transporter permease subunit [Conexibacter sp. JD483]